MTMTTNLCRQLTHLALIKPINKEDKVDFWIYHVKFAVINPVGNIMEFLAAMVVLDFSNVAFIKIGHTNVGHKAICVGDAPLIKYIEINVEPVAWLNVLT